MKLLHGDCLQLMTTISDGSVDMILCDLPYGTTQNSWDTIIPFEPLWENYNRIIKPNGAIVLTASQPFTSRLVMSNLKMFRYEWIWKKSIAANFGNLKFSPAKHHESVLVFSQKTPKYCPQMGIGQPYSDAARSRKNTLHNKGFNIKSPIKNKGTRFPSSVILISNPNNKNLHPTQKPLALFEYLIKTYTHEGETVLDNCMGSGTAGVACINTNRNFIGIEQDDCYFKIAADRIAAHPNKLLIV